MKYFVETPSHGYLRIPTSELKKLGIIPQITGFSKIGVRVSYLEEDCDYGTYLKASGASHSDFPTVYKENFDIHRMYDIREAL